MSGIAQKLFRTSTQLQRSIKGLLVQPSLRNQSLLSRNVHNTVFVLNTNERVSKERKYTKKHEWVSVNGCIGTVGISEFAQDALGELVYVQLPEVGDNFAVSAEIGALESVKAAAEVYAPVSGEILEKNEQVEETPSLVNTSCYEKGWLYKVKLEDEKELDNLMSEDVYQEYLKSQTHD